MSIILLSMIPAFILILSVTALERERALADAHVEAMAFARLAANHNLQLVKTTENLLRWLAHFPEISSGDPGVCNARLQELFKELNGYGGLSVARPDGEVFCLAPATPPATPLNSANLPYFQRAMAKKAFAIGGFQLGRLSNKPNFSFGYPLVDSAGKVRAVIGAGLDVDQLNQTLAMTQLPAYANLLILDTKGTVMVRYPAQAVGQTFTNSTFIQTILQQHEGVQEMDGLDGVRRLYAFTFAGEQSAPDFYVIVGILPAHIYAGVNRTLSSSLLGLGVIGLAALIAAWVSAEFMIVRRAKRITGAALRLRAGDLSARTGIMHDSTELGELARTFDAMAIALQQRAEENQHLMEETQRLNGELEQRVLARTLQLQNINTKLLESQTELRKLSQQLIQITEQERTRISREIHDQLGQSLTAIKMELRSAQKRLGADQPSVLEKLNAISALADETIQTVRRIATGLRPGILDDFGLEATVEWQLQEFEQRSGIHCELAAALDEAKLDADMSTAAFRILQEALTNVARHAGATEVVVTLTTDAQRFMLIVQDNGQGIQEEQPSGTTSLGLFGMRERAMQLGGFVEITSVEGQGTTVTLTLPLPESTGQEVAR
ncbi:MAG: histidine kinase [Caldilineaceae bacterium]